MTPVIYYTGLSPLPEKFGHRYSGQLYHVPTIQIQWLPPPSAHWSDEIPAPDALWIFTSKNGVRGLQHWLDPRTDPLPFANNELWAIGNTTAELIQKTWDITPRVPHDASANGLIAEFEQIYPQTVVLVSAQRGRPELPRWFQTHQWNLITLPVYQTHPVQQPELRRHFKNSPCETLFFTAPSTVTGFMNTFALNGLQHLQTHLAGIGPTTSEFIRQQGGTVFFESANAGVIPGLTELMRTLTPSSKPL